MVSGIGVVVVKSGSVVGDGAVRVKMGSARNVQGELTKK